MVTVSNSFRVGKYLHVVVSTEIPGPGIQNPLNSSVSILPRTEVITNAGKGIIFVGRECFHCESRLVRFVIRFNSCRPARARGPSLSTVLTQRPLQGSTSFSSLHSNLTPILICFVSR